MDYLDQDDADLEGVKIPPHSQEAEQSVLGGLMLDNNAWDTVSSIVMEDQFYRHDHRLIYRCIEKLSNNMQPIDVVTISEELDRTGNLDAAGGLDYLIELARNTPSASNIQGLCRDCSRPCIAAEDDQRCQRDCG